MEDPSTSYAASPEKCSQVPHRCSQCASHHQCTPVNLQSFCCSIAAVSPALHSTQITLCFVLLWCESRVILPCEQHVVKHSARPNARHSRPRALLLMEPCNGTPPHQAPDNTSHRTAHCLVRKVELRLRGARHNRPRERHHEPGQQRVPAPIRNQVLRGAKHLPFLDLLVQRGQPEHLEVRAVAAEAGGEGEDAERGARHDLRGQRAPRAGQARAAERAAVGGARRGGGRRGGGGGWLGGEGEPEPEVGEEHAAEAAGGGPRGGGRHAEVPRERRVGQARREAREREREEHRRREGGVGEERVEQAREEVEGGRRHAEREREVVRARGRQRQRLRLRRRRGWSRRHGFLDVRAGVVAAPALARGGGGGRRGGGGVEEEERGGGGGVGGGEEEEGRHGEGQVRRARMAMVEVEVRWLSRRCCEIREDFVWRGTRSQ
ncbi:hypothetical protein EJB05_46062, partial [Eragrostis curvula]